MRMEEALKRIQESVTKMDGYDAAVLACDGEVAERLEAGKDETGKFVVHERPMKSLAKTEDLSKFVETFRLRRPPQGRNPNKDFVTLMWKLDGVSVELVYDKGDLVSAATRGDGKVGQDILKNVKNIDGISMHIPELENRPYKYYDGRYMDHQLVVRGEVVMSYADFAAANKDGAFSSPRNLTAATLTKKPSDMAGKHLQFRAFEIVKLNSYGRDRLKDNEFGHFSDRLSWLEQYFPVVGYKWCLVDNLAEYVAEWTRSSDSCEFPVDGLVAAYDDALYTDRPEFDGTDHHPSPVRAFAMKWTA